MTLVPAERETAALAFVCGYHDPQRQRIAGGKRMFDLRRREFITLLGGREHTPARARSGLDFSGSRRGERRIEEQLHDLDRWRVAARRHAQWQIRQQCPFDCRSQIAFCR